EGHAAEVEDNFGQHRVHEIAACYTESGRDRRMRMHHRAHVRPRAVDAQMHPYFGRGGTPRRHRFALRRELDQGLCRDVHLGESGGGNEDVSATEPYADVAVLTSDQPAVVQPPADGDDLLGDPRPRHGVRYARRRWITRPSTTVQ